MTDLISRDAAILIVKTHDKTRDILNELALLPTAVVVQQPAKCEDNIVQEYDNGMVAMTKETWNDALAYTLRLTEDNAMFAMKEMGIKLPKCKDCVYCKDVGLNKIDYHICKRKNQLKVVHSNDSCIYATKEEEQNEC